MKHLLNDMLNGNRRSLSRLISFLEDGRTDIFELSSFIEKRPPNNKPVIGFTGPPGAGKSTLITSLVHILVRKGIKPAIIAVDPSSPFSGGAILGDRIRMAELSKYSDVFIRSLATRGTSGGLSARTFEIEYLLQLCGFDMILIETVGVGQNEVEIASLADITVLVLVPESGDDIQTIKSGVMEIADIYVINKADRDGADSLYNSIKNNIHIENKDAVKTVLKCSNTDNISIEALAEKLLKFNLETSEKNKYILFEKAMHLIKEAHLKKIDYQMLKEEFTREVIEQRVEFIEWVKKHI